MLEGKSYLLIRAFFLEESKAFRFLYLNVLDSILFLLGCTCLKLGYICLLLGRIQTSLFRGPTSFIFSDNELLKLTLSKGCLISFDITDALKLLSSSFKRRLSSSLTERIPPSTPPPPLPPSGRPEIGLPTCPKENEEKVQLKLSWKDRQARKKKAQKRAKSNHQATFHERIGYQILYAWFVREI